MKETRKMLVSDYDQTFYLNDIDIDNNKVLVEKFQNKGNIFVIATGRSYEDFIKKREKYNIKYDYLIINHGATILNSKDEVLNNFTIDNKIIEEFQKDLEINYAIRQFNCSKLKSRVSFDHLDLTKIHVKYKNEEVTNRVYNKILKKYKKYLNIFLIRENEIEIIAKNIDKKSAIDFLRKRICLKKRNIFTIGDGYNDINMIKSYKGYCMVNSVNKLKKVCKKETKSVSEVLNFLISKR